MNLWPAWWRENASAIFEQSLSHIGLVAVAMACALAIGLPSGIWIARRPRWQRLVLALANVFQTVPSLALFGLLIPILGIGAPTAIVALVLYALLPIVRNTLSGIAGVDPNVREAARALGFSDRQLLWHVELPLASGVILAGARVATVLCVGVTTIAATIDAGGLGQSIFRGLRQDDNALILAGAVPAALLALLADALLGRLEKKPTQVLAGTTGTTSSARGDFAPSDFAPLHSPPRRAQAVGAGVLLVGLLSGALYWRGARREFNAGSGAQASGQRLFVVASKDFSESVILAEIFAQSLEARGVAVRRRFELAGNLSHQSLLAGAIDIYPEYTGTAFTAILKRKPQTDVARVYALVKSDYKSKFGLEVGPPLGFSNDFAILVRQADATKFGLQTISEAARYTPTRVAGFGQDFMSRADGYQGFARAYNLKFARAPREMDLSLTYRALASGQVDMIAGNATDGLIGALKLFQLKDDRKYFPPYQAIFIARSQALEASREARQVLQALGNVITTDEMRAMNLAADRDKQSPVAIARAWRQKHGL